MKITREKDAIKIYEDSTAIFFSKSTQPNAAEGESTYFLGAGGEDAVTEPGEYEFSTFGLIAVEAKVERDNKADLFKIEFDGINLLIKSGSIQELTKEDLDLIGEVSVLVIYGEDEKDQINQLIKKVTPQMVILVDYDKAQAEAALNIEIAEELKTIKLKRSDFGDEEVAQRFVGLIK